jgi:hypothetical protein
MILYFGSLTPPEDINALLLGGAPPCLYGAIHFTRINLRFFKLWRQAPPFVAFLVLPKCFIP